MEKDIRAIRQLLVVIIIMMILFFIGTAFAEGRGAVEREDCELYYERVKKIASKSLGGMTSDYKIGVVVALNLMYQSCLLREEEMDRHISKRKGERR